MEKAATECQISERRKGTWKKEGSRRGDERLLVFHFFLIVAAAMAVRPASSQHWDGVVITQADYEGLQALKHELEDRRGFLRSWNGTGLGACSGAWEGIKCARGKVIAIQLPWRGLGGEITEKIGQLTALRKLSLHDNSIGGQIPQALGFLRDLRGLYLFNNRFAGAIPLSIGNCVMLQTLDLSSNLLTGTVPSSLLNFTRLYRLNLSYNNLSGVIPREITGIPSLASLLLQHNNLSGSIPDTWGGAKALDLYQLRTLSLDHNSLSGNIPISLGRLRMLEEVSLSSNQLNGSIPEEVGALPRLRMLDLSENSMGGSLPASLCILSSLVQLNLKSNQLENQIPAALGNISGLLQLDLSENNLTGAIPASLEQLTNLTFFNVSDNHLSGPVPILLSERFNSNSFSGNIDLCGYSVLVPCAPPPSSSPSLPFQSGSPQPNRRKLRTKEIIIIVAGLILLVLLSFGCALLCCLLRKKPAVSEKSNTAAAAAGRDKKPGPAEGTEAEEAGGDAAGKLVHLDGPVAFSSDDLLCATAEIMGKSTYGTVYKATLQDGGQVAVKRMREKLAKNQKEFEAEVSLLGKIRHPNLLALRAYYLGPKGEKLLVFDFMPNGSLASFLHGRDPNTPVDWPTRMNIAMGMACGLCHLHVDMKMVHGNLTSGNILLDENTNAKISDFGLYRLMTGAASSSVIAAASALGYRAPELSKLKKANPKTDMYSLGVIMLELLTGKSPSEPINGMDLPQWVASTVKEEWTNEVFDLELMKDAEEGDELLNTLKLALHCVDPSPAARPEIQQVLQQLEQIKPELATSAGGEGADADVAEATKT